MNTSVGTALSHPQGFGESTAERLPLMERASMTEAQRAAADALIAGPRKGVKGPFVALLRSPVLMERFADVGACLRFESVIATRINEFVTSVVARELGNQFEWCVHRPLAIAAGVAPAVMDDLAQGARPCGMVMEEALAYDFTIELMRRNGVCDATYASALACWGEQGIVELSALIGYFATVSWVMNVARTPAPADSTEGRLGGFPA